MLTRRSTIAAIAMCAAGTSDAQERKRGAATRPLVIAHRGCSGERPEETRLAYELAVEEGADFIEPDLVPTKDGHLVARHENEIGGTTDVGSRPEFAARKTAKIIDGATVAGWFTEDFTLAELKTLGCRERLPQLRPDSARYDGLSPILTYQEVIDIAKAGSRRTGRTIGTYPEMKHPTYFASIGLPLEQRLAHMLKVNDLDSPTAPIFVQCFEVGALKTFARLSSVPRVQLMDDAGGPADLPHVTYADMATPDGLKTIRSYADAIGPDQDMVLDFKAEPRPVATRLVTNAHEAGLAVHSWTARRENVFLPRSLQAGDPTSPGFDRQTGDIGLLLRTLFKTGIDGVFSDYPALASRARQAVLG